MNINDLVVGRLYKVKNELESSDYEKNEDVVMFLRAYSKKIYVITLTGEYKSISIDRMEMLESDYMDVFEKDTIEKFSLIMRKFLSEYQKHENIKFSKKKGFKSSTTQLTKLNSLQQELKNLNLLPRISLAVENYFEIYKELGATFESIEDIIVDFAYIPEWEENFNKLRGFDFSSKNISPKKIKKYTNEALMLHHLYTNLFLKPNFKNIKAEWLDLLLDKFKKYSPSINTNDSIISTINSIKWKCILEGTVSENKEENKIDSRINFNL